MKAAFCLRALAPRAGGSVGGALAFPSFSACPFLACCFLPHPPYYAGKLKMFPLPPLVVHPGTWIPQPLSWASRTGVSLW